MAEGVFQTSFAAGELSPNLYAREDIEKYVSGASLMRNFYVDYRGGTSFRPGTEFMKNFDNAELRLIEFIFSTDQAYVIGLGDTVLYVFQHGALVATLSAPWALADIWLVKYVQSADVMTLVHPDYPPYNLSRTTLTTFTLDLVQNGPSIAPPTNLSAMASTPGNLRYGYCITALTANGEESLGSFPDYADSVALDPTNATPKTISITWDRVSGAKAYNVYKWGPVPNDQPMSTLFGYIGQTKAAAFTDTNVAPDFSRVPPDYRDPFSPGQISDIEIVNDGSGFSGYVNITITGDGTGAEAYGIADDAGNLSAVVVTHTGKDYTSATATASGGSGEVLAVTVDTGNHYPSTVTYFQQRRVYGGADSTPELLEMSQVGAFENFDVSPAVLDSDAITVNIASRQVNDIKSLVPMSTGLIVYTTGCAFLISGGGDNQPVTPSNISAVPQASTGANDIAPITVNYNILFVQNKGTIVRDMAFSFQTQSYYGVDRSMLANHLFFGYSIVDWAWAEEPYKLLWVVRNDGRLLCMTYVPDQEVYGWSQHDTNGLFTSVTTVPENGQDVTYFMVRRFIQADQVWKYYFERLSFQVCDCPADAAYLDSFVSLPMTPGNSELKLKITGTTVNGTFSEGLIGSSYTMTALENYGPEQLPLLNEPGIYYELLTSHTYTSDSFDPVTRRFYYSICVQFNDDVLVPYTLWDGDTAYPANEPVDTNYAHNYYTLIKDMATGAITTFNAYSPDKTVPAGIGGGDGTWRRTMDTYADTYQLRKLIDPRTQNIWVHTYGSSYPCGLALLRAEDDYAQVISPVQYSAHMEIAGLSDDWLHVIRGNYNAGNDYFLIPRLITSDEITADRLLEYATFAAFPSYTFWRSVMGPDGKTWWITFQSTHSGGPATVTRNYKLWRFDEPTSAPYGGPTVGGGFTEITPWASNTGPNGGDAPNYNKGAAFNLVGGYNQSIIFMIRRTTDVQDTLAIITKLMPACKTAGSRDPALLQFDMTYYDTNTAAWETHAGFVKGYMKADWTPASGADDAAYAVIDVQETNKYLDYNSFAYYNTPDEVSGNYNLRWLFFTVVKVVDGAWEYSTNNLHVVIVQYEFVYGSPPQLLQVFDEDLWYSNYAYMGYANPMAKAVDVLQGQADAFYEWGLWDETTKAWYWGGAWTQEAMGKLNPAYATRGVAAFPRSSMPFLKISYAPSVDQFIDIGCGTILVNSIDSQGFTGTLVTDPNKVIPNDPFGTISPIPSGDWFINTATNQIGVPHLRGMEVGLLVDGLVMPKQIVPYDGIIKWPEAQATTRAVCGLPYQGQVKTMYLTTGEPTTQGRMKVVSQVIVRVTCTLGIKVGPDFDDLVECKDTMVIPYSAPPEHFQGDIQVNVMNDWNLYGQIAIQQDYPLPATILGVIPQVVIGDDD